MSSADYRTTIEVLRAFGHTELAEKFEAEADKCETRELYAYELGMIGVADYPALRGAKLMGYLAETGWTPPEGLF